MMVLGVIGENGGAREEWYEVDGLCILWSVMIRKLDVNDRMVLYVGFEWIEVISLDNEDMVMVFIGMKMRCW